MTFFSKETETETECGQKLLNSGTVITVEIENVFKTKND